MTDLASFDYELPRELIAQSPLEERSRARLLIVDRQTGKFTHTHVSDLPNWLGENDCLVLNDTKVIPARLLGHRTATGGRWEGLFLESTPDGLWRVMGQTRGTLQVGEEIGLDDRQAKEDLRIELVAKLDDGTWVVRPVCEEPTLTILNRVGRVPLPPYIRGGEMMPDDIRTYQTVFAEHPGAIAAPTAGLHFTETLLEDIQAVGVAICRLTLHVGIGTFRPINTPTLEDFQMHAEWGEIRESTVERINERRSQGGRVVAVGTTSVRVLETAAASGQLKAFRGETNLFIHPPYEFKCVDALMTNFHLPRTTLLVLVSTLAGRELILRAYAEAVRAKYRLFSYGDAMLIF